MAVPEAKSLTDLTKPKAILRAKSDTTMSGGNMPATANYKVMMAIADEPTSAEPKEVKKEVKKEGVTKKTSSTASYKSRSVGASTKLERMKLPLLTKIAYGTGHVLNDLCASLWFSYYLFYLQNVVKLTHDVAAGLMLLGQVVDGVATPLVGFAQDKNVNCNTFNYGQCKSWHLLGTIMVLISFPFVFSPPITGDRLNDWEKFGYYSPFVFMFQVGWASTQVSHLALLPIMTPSQLVRTELLAVRYGFTVASNLTIFVITWLIVGFQSGGDNVIDATFAIKFRNIALIAVSIGFFFILIFHIFIQEDDSHDVYSILAPSEVAKRVTDLRSSYKRFFAGEIAGDDYKIHEEDYEPPKEPVDEPVNSCCPANILSTKFLSTRFQKHKLTISDWIYLPQFYIVGLIYMVTRMSVNLTQVYMPIYLYDSLRLANSTVATVPLAMYLSGFFIALVIKPLNKYLGSQLSYTFGATLSLCGAILLISLDWDSNHFLRTYGIYGVAVLIGGGSSAILVISLSITADLIGNHVGNSAFVYGVMSFTDKLSCGLAVMLINSVLHPIFRNDIAFFYRNVVAVCCGGSALLGVLGVLILTVILCIESRNPVIYFDAADEKQQRHASLVSKVSSKNEDNQSTKAGSGSGREKARSK